jgi:ABC-2 type transport system ATP-binding protein
MEVARMQGVTKRYGPVTALEALDFVIREGELVALLGPNGAGKTTTVRLLLGLAAPSSGQVAVFDRDPRRPEARRRVGAMLQAGKVPETLRVREHIELFSSYYRTPLTVEEAVAAAALGGLENRLFAKLSAGQQRRVLFALAICGNPSLLFLDEPTASLDIEARRSLWEHIRRFVARDGSVLLTTHHLEEADALADRIAVLHRGRIVAEGTPSEIKARTALKKVRCVTRLDGQAVRAIAGAGQVSVDRAHTEILTAEAERVTQELLVRDPELRDLCITAGGLEEALVALTGN